MYALFHLCTAHCRRRIQCQYGARWEDIETRREELPWKTWRTWKQSRIRNISFPLDCGLPFLSYGNHSVRPTIAQRHWPLAGFYKEYGSMNRTSKRRHSSQICIIPNTKYICLALFLNSFVFSTPRRRPICWTHSVYHIWVRRYGIFGWEGWPMWERSRLVISEMTFVARYREIQSIVDCMTPMAARVLHARTKYMSIPQFRK